MRGERDRGKAGAVPRHSVVLVGSIRHTVADGRLGGRIRPDGFARAAGEWKVFGILLSGRRALRGGFHQPAGRPSGCPAIDHGRRFRYARAGGRREHGLENTSGRTGGGVRRFINRRFLPSPTEATAAAATAGFEARGGFDPSNK